MSNERKPGYYWAKRQKDSDNEIVFISENRNVHGRELLVHEISMYWISPQTIEDEILGLKYKADTLSDMLADNDKQMKVMEEDIQELILQLEYANGRFETGSSNSVISRMKAKYGATHKNDSITKP